eukprot:12598027-Prorocentrum_lima.AAC.1
MLACMPAKKYVGVPSKQVKGALGGTIQEEWGYEAVWGCFRQASDDEANTRQVLTLLVVALPLLVQGAFPGGAGAQGY